VDSAIEAEETAGGDADADVDADADSTPQRNSGRGPTTGYYSPADWSKLSFKERDQIRKDHDKRGKQGGTKRSVAQVLFLMDDTSKLTPNTNIQAGNAFGGKQSAAKKAKGPGE
jgi:phage terminase small subunit